MNFQLEVGNELRYLLKGNMKGCESIHLKGDWLLTFKVDEEFLNFLMLEKYTQVYKNLNDFLLGEVGL